MQKKGIFWAGILLFFLYFISMVIEPIVSAPLCTTTVATSEGIFCRWDSLLATWREWQSFNAGMIAFLASVLAAYVAYYIWSENQKARVIALKTTLGGHMSNLPSQVAKINKILRESYAHLLNDNSHLESVGIDTLNEVWNRPLIDKVKACLLDVIAVTVDIKEREFLKYDYKKLSIIEKTVFLLESPDKLEKDTCKTLLLNGIRDCVEVYAHAHLIDNAYLDSEAMPGCLALDKVTYENINKTIAILDLKKYKEVTEFYNNENHPDRKGLKHILGISF